MKKIPLIALFEETPGQTLYVKAILLNELGIALAASPVDLVQSSLGYYSDFSVNMPNNLGVKAKYEIYTDDQYTLLSDEYETSEDVFTLEPNVNVVVNGGGEQTIGCAIKGQIINNSVILSEVVKDKIIIGVIKDE